MSRENEHFRLQQWQQPLQRQLRGRSNFPKRESREDHGKGLLEEANQLVETFKERIETSPKGINPQLVFKLQLEGNLEDEDLERFGLKVLARNSSKAVVVFPNEASLQELRQRTSEYGGLVAEGHKYDQVSAIKAILDLTPEDRIGDRLKARPLEADEIAALDVEIFHTGNRDLCYQQIQEIQVFLEDRNLRVTDTWVGDYLCLLRARVNLEALDVLLKNTDYVREVDRRAAPSYEILPVRALDISQVNVIETVPEDLVGVLVIDSGVMQGHPLIGPALGDAQVFPDKLRLRVTGGAEDGDRQVGHGTAVAGISIYNDIGECINRRDFTPSARLFSAKITDENNEYDEDELLEHQLEDAITYFLDNYPSVKVINISHGDARLVYSDSKYQFRFAAAVDELAYRFRDREIVFTICSGNFMPNIPNEQIKRQYPKYLLDQSTSRIIDPATSAIALTVGGLSYGAGKLEGKIEQDDIKQLIAGEKGWPSPFTRTGWGLGGAIKPDVVDFAGDWRFERGRVEGGYYAGLPTTSRNFAPPNSNLFTLLSGTSFAAPRVANLAARLFREFPDASSNLIRALIAESASIPENFPPYFKGKKPWDEEVLRIYGYGQPDFERARRSGQNDVLLLEDNVIELNAFTLYEIPPLPDDFKTYKDLKAHISITLAFDPPTRITRADSYLGVNMEFALFRNVDSESLAKALRTLTDEEKEELENKKDLPSLKKLEENINSTIRVDMKPGVNKRKTGTLQRGYFRIPKGKWEYNGGPLILAVLSRRKWAPANITHQRYAVIASLYHDDPLIDIYSHVRQHARLYQRPRVRV